MRNNPIKRPWSTQIEMTFGCDNRCPFCYKQVLNKPREEYEFLTPKTAKEISIKMNKSGWDGLRIEFALRGEPLLDPYFFKNINIFHKYLPNSQILVTTNGNNLTPKKAIKFFKAGGNILVVDCYKNDLNKRKKIYNNFKVYDYYEDDFNPWERHDPKNTHVIVLLDNLAKRNNEKKTRVILNAGGNVDFNKTKKFGIFPLKEPIKYKCSKPFREIIFLYDGTIPLCCEDSNEDCKLGNIYHIPDLDVFWRKNKKLNVVRLLLFNKIRYNVPCRNCDFKGTSRIGLLPKMKYLSEEEIKNIKELVKTWS